MIDEYVVEKYEDSEINLDSLLSGEFSNASRIFYSHKIIFNVDDINTNKYALINLGMVFAYNSLAKSLGRAPKRIESKYELASDTGYNNLLLDLINKKINSINYQEYSSNTGFIIAPIAKSSHEIDIFIADFKNTQSIVDKEYEWLHYPKKGFLNEGLLSFITRLHFEKFMQSRDIYKYVVKDTIGSYIAIGFYIMLTYIDSLKGVAPRRFKIINKDQTKDISLGYLRLLEQIEGLRETA